MRVLSGLDESDDSNGPDPEVAIRITVPQEFAGWSMGEITVRRGFITDMDAGGENAVIRGRLPKSKYAALADALAAGTRDLARLEQE